jgi:hypothetical protein
VVDPRAGGHSLAAGQQDCTDCMPEIPRGVTRREGAIQRLSDCLFWLPTEEKREACELFRHQYESQHGPTDLSVRYTSTWPSDQQQWLFLHEPQRWLDGLPDYVKAFIKQEIEAAHRRQGVNVKAKEWIRDYLGGECHEPGHSPSSRLHRR